MYLSKYFRKVLMSTMSTIKYAMKTIVDSANTADPDVKAHNELPHLNIQCLFSRFLFWHFM